MLPLTLSQFAECLTREWSDPESRVNDPTIIIEEQDLARRMPGGQVAVHVIVISDQWPVSTPEERAKVIQDVASRVDPASAARSRLFLGVTSAEAEQQNIGYIFSSPDFGAEDIVTMNSMTLDKYLEENKSEENKSEQSEAA